MKKYGIYILVGFMTACQTVEKYPETSVKPQESEIQQLPLNYNIEIPEKQSAQEDEVLLNHKHFKISYSKKHRLPNWVYYTVTKEELELKKGDRKKVRGYPDDPILVEMGIDPVHAEDYSSNEFHNGHMAPANDFTRSQDAIASTFFMSNMTPQEGGLNSGAWAQLERVVHNWGCSEGKISVITGPILKPHLKKITKGISLPEKFFKAVYDLTPPIKSVCFIYDQGDRGVKYFERAMSVDDCERKIGFQLTTDKELKKTESEFNLKEWKVGKCG